jgi:anaphase-promoting complex subunit 1
MASVKSLGLHQPAGLQHAIEEELLPDTAPASSYTWDIFLDEVDSEEVDDELLTTKDCVIWCRGSIFRKTFKFHLEKEPITQAILAYFPTEAGSKADHDGLNGHPDKQPSLEKALVVLLKTQAHIYFLSGTTHIVHMPFEAECAFAGPVGVIIQRKQKTENIAPLSLRFPRVPPNSFVSSQLTAFNSSQLTTFSLDGLGNPRQLPVSHGLNIENTWEAPLEQSDSHWPRLVSLTDPLLEIGLVVADTDRERANGPIRANKKPVFLDPAEELLHVEKIKLPGLSSKSHAPLVVAVTANRENNTCSVWRLTYLPHEDPVRRQQKPSRTKSSRRRSSMQPGFVSGTSTPIPAQGRESFGAPLPGKRQRKSERHEKHEKPDKPLDLMSSLEQQDKEGTGVARRSSRRVSSMLARADLSASHERSVFNEQAHMPSFGPMARHESHSSQYARLSSTYNQQIHPSLSSLLAAPIDEGLGDDFLGMGLDDHSFDGLQQEVILTKIHSVTLDKSNVRYSTSSQPARDQSRVFILTAPPFATNDYQRSQLLIGIQDSVEKRLQLIYLHLKLQPKFDLAARAGRKDHNGEATVSVIPGEVRIAQNVVDSCKLIDGDQSAILILSESNGGRHELSTQAPWRELTKISLSVLFVDDTRNLQYRGRKVDRDVQQKKSEIIDIANGSIVGIRHPRRRGVVDVLDMNDRLHQLRIQLQPSCPQVSKVLNMCKGTLPDTLGERIHAGWFHAMQWISGYSEPINNEEWSALVVLLLSSVLNLGRTDATAVPPTQAPVRRRRIASGSFGSINESDDWKALETGETSNSLGCPPWMLNRGWQWALDQELGQAMSTQHDQGVFPTFISKHIHLAKEFMASSFGDASLGPGGYLPTSLGKDPEARRKAAADILLALHFLLEEEKLDIMTPEYTSPGRVDLRVMACQIARWLRWNSFASIYELGIQEDIDPRYDSGMPFSLGPLSARTNDDRIEPEASHLSTGPTS